MEINEVSGNRGDLAFLTETQRFKNKLIHDKPHERREQGKVTKQMT